MTKKLIKDINEFRQWAWKTLEEFDDKYEVERALGLKLVRDCYDYNEKDESIDENGNVIPEDTAETVKLADWVTELQFPVVAVYWLEKEWDRHGNVTIVAVDVVSLQDFEEKN